MVLTQIKKRRLLMRGIDPKKRFLGSFVMIGVCVITFLIPDTVSACTVCFGDPNSPMTHGAKAAIIFLLGVVAFVLGSIVAVAIFWIRRARLVQIQSILRGEKRL